MAETAGPTPQPHLDEDAALRSILEGTATETGERFFAALVERLSEALGTSGAWVTEYLPEAHRLRAIAFRLGDRRLDGYEYDLAGTPCETVVAGPQLVHIPERVVALYPDDPDLRKFDAVSYMGAPLQDVDGTVLGHLAVLDARPLPAAPRTTALFRIFAARAAAELQRLRAEAAVREREERLRRLVESAMDAIIELDGELRVTLVNPAAEKALGAAAAEIVGRDFVGFLAEDSRAALRRLVTELGERPDGRRALWIPGGLRLRAASGEEIAAEATLSRSERDRAPFHTLILRNVNERIEAERRIRALTGETEYLREEIRALQGFDEILGRSAPMRQVLRDVRQVAETDATVLIEGETGTGKELVARAIHAASRRRARPLVTVNCAAMPAALVESELFGHERGAFTGATARREGRFALADGGTILLDEVGELPVDLQAKLLRVLQEGEVTPVGSAVTRKVDVRVLAATNRDLAREVREGRFREDLYYRLHVFPLRVPPLRERREDVAVLAAAFAERFAQRMRRPLAPLSVADARRLEAYDWPGNVRELQNVIERAVITAVGERLNLERALPEASGVARAGGIGSAQAGGAGAGGAAAGGAAIRSAGGAAIGSAGGAAIGSAGGAAIASAGGAGVAAAGGDRVYTVAEMQELERRNVLRALEAAAWKVAGENGAARLLGMSPSTLTSRMKALGIARPRAG
jgi:PAS domain S-box-containing protein